MSVLDTSVLLAIFQDTDPQHEESIKQLDSAPALRVPHEVLCEFMGVLQHRRKFEMARDALDFILRISKLRVLEALPVDRTRGVWHENRGRLSWVDATVVWWAQELKTSALAFDPQIQAALAKRA